jgi:hypothetical protein
LCKTERKFQCLLERLDQHIVALAGALAFAGVALAAQTDLLRLL